MSGAELTPVIEIGGSHVVVATVLGRGADLRIGTLVRSGIDSAGDAGAIVSQIAAAADSVDVPSGLDWMVAIPGPFDYVSGMGRFSRVGKFEALRGVNLRDELMSALSAAPASIHFINDAEAFGLGEARVGLARDRTRSIALTLGTGIGSTFIDDGNVVTAGSRVPPEGHAYLWTYLGSPLEETISSRALTRDYLQATGLSCDVREILDRARHGEKAASTIADRSFSALGVCIGAWVDMFDATAVVVGGSMARSWDVIEAPIARGIAGVLGARWRGRVSIMPTDNTVEAAVLGAASWLLSRRGAALSAEPPLT